MISAILSIVPTVITSAIGAIGAAYAKSKDVSIAALQATAGVASAQAQYMTAVLGHPLSPPSICCYALAIWFFKAVACDKVIGPALGYAWSTDPLSGGTKELAMIVASGMFFSGIANILRRGQ